MISHKELKKKTRKILSIKKHLHGISLNTHKKSEF